MKDTIKKMRRQATYWEKMHKTNLIKYCYSKYTQNFKNATMRKKQHKWKWVKDLNRHLSLWLLRRWRICLQGGRPGFDPWVGKIPWRRKLATHDSILARDFYRQRSLVGYSPQGQQNVRHNWATNAFRHLIKEYIQKARKDMKWWFTSYVIKDTQNKNEVTLHTC